MSRGVRRQAPALILSGLALLAALSGSVYAAGKAGRISGKTIKVKSLPGNRLAMGSVPWNRLKPGAIHGGQLAPGSVTGLQIDVSRLGEVPAATWAERAQSTQHAETAQNAVNAENAKSINGFTAGCKSNTVPFAGACWEATAQPTALTAPAAASACASIGGELPDALSLAAFSQQPGMTLAAGDEWANDITSFTSLSAYSLATVNAAGEIGGAVSTSTRKFRCAIPLVG